MPEKLSYSTSARPRNRRFLLELSRSTYFALYHAGEISGLTDRVCFCGTREDILGLYHAADAFVLSSAFEGLSAALLEASAMGLPAVVTDTGGNPEIVLDGVTGHLVPPGDPARLAAAMKKLAAASSEERQRLGAAARQHCWANYRFEAIARRWTDLYSLYLRRARSPSATTAGSLSPSRLRL